MLKDRIPLPVYQWLWIAVLLEYTLLFLFCFLNWKRKSVRLIALACFLNFFVIAWYGFRMPVAPIIMTSRIWHPRFPAYSQERYLSMSWQKKAHLSCF